ncbi:hypothetical protein Lser_V15G23363 [Lactuca serriola]
MVLNTFIVVVLGLLISKADNVCCKTPVDEKKTSFEHGAVISNVPCVPSTTISCGLNDIALTEGHAKTNLVEGLVDYNNSTNERHRDSSAEVIRGIIIAINGAISRLNLEISLSGGYAGTAQNSIINSEENAAILNGVSFQFGGYASLISSAEGTLESIQQQLESNVGHLVGSFVGDTGKMLDVGFKNGSG